MKTIFEAIRLDREFTEAERTLEAVLRSEHPLPLIINGLSGGALPAFVSEMLRPRLSERSALILVPDENEARHTALLLTAADIPAVLYRKRDFVTYPVTASHGIERERLSVLQKLLTAPTVVVTTPDAAMQYTMPRRLLSRLSLSLSVGKEIPPLSLAEKLLSMGFSEVTAVEGKGQFSRHNGIFDIFSPAEEMPVRMEFFGDEIDRMGYFDPLTQRIFENAPSLSILPAREVLVSDEARKAIASAVEAKKKKAAAEAARATLKSELSAIEAGLDLSFADKYISLVYPEAETLLHYFSDGARPLLFVIGSAAVKKAAETAEKSVATECTMLVEEELLSSRYASFGISAAALYSFADTAATLHVNSFADSTGSLRSSGIFGFRSRRTVSYGNNLSLLLEDIRHLSEQKYRTVLACENKAALLSYDTSLRENGITPVILASDGSSIGTLPYGAVALAAAPLSEGFELLTARVSVISTVEEDTERAAVKKRRLRRALKKSGAGERILSYAELSEGDYVVHDTHGIGQYECIESMTVGGVTRDYVRIRYAGTDKIHIPADRIETISKYIGARDTDGGVKLSKLGGTEWYRTKERARAAAKDIAKDLIRLYAERKRRMGFAFPPDSVMETEFESAFEFEETPSQLAAIEEIKADMMKETPMDRLLCGDVGFGKTEVALRAAFKAIVAGKQVAILVPTTILALQHYETALSRMRGYPVSIDMLSRFRTPAAQAKTLRRLARGECDLVIGTHSLLSKSVAFKDLGLLIVDEEQRFGVSQKEKLKEMSTNVDVLTLTATPIPRTLNMAMSGIRDMSILDEAPGLRYPVETYVLEHDDLLILEAIRKELRRAGQVLYLYNRVETIDLVAGRIQKAIPEARVTYAHGQMDKDDLEDIWQALVRGEIDVLVCTTIIETGVDLPNANTLIIEDSDRMGLAQLHQIRGRVGRSGRHAYAYFTYRRGKVLTDIAQKRLSAIREYTEFGAGFRVALRDLEIRGAGNLLGAEQHGHIDAVGYEMYVRILNEAILDARGEVAVTPFESKIDIRCDASIPESYIASSAQRMEMYKKISLILTEKDREDVLDELCDRFGEPPRITLRLLSIALLRSLASRARISRVEAESGTVRFIADSYDLAIWSELFAAESGLQMTGGTRPCVTYRLQKGKDAPAEAARLLSRYDEIKRSFTEETQQ